MLRNSPCPALRELLKEEQPGLILLAVALLLTLLFHGTLLFNLQYFRTYDALIHTFFGAHYAQSWFDPWEPRWYTGFSLVSYPPLSHFLIALASKVVGLKLAFAPVQLFALLQLTVGIYRFSRLFVAPKAAGFAALALVLSSAIAETVHVFGQLPTTLSLGFLLNAIPWVWAYIRTGRWGYLLKASVWIGSTTAAHHVTTLFGSVFFIGPVVAMLVLEGLRQPRPGEPSGRGLFQQVRRRVYRVLPRLYRTGVFGMVAIVALVLVVLPYWLWSRSDPIAQVPIPHGSRANFLQQPNMGLMFWLIPWASSLVFLPYAFYKSLSYLWPLGASLGLLLVLGTGGTTPIPKLLLRGAFDILTLDRFTFWATILVLPFVGMALQSALEGRLRLWLEANFGRRVRLLLLLGLVLFVVTASIGISTLTRYRKFQPETIEIAPILSFIEKDEHWRYRYLTLGFGDQMAWLSANTRASTPDGNYHSARRLPELTTTPVERLEGAKYTGVPGIGSLQQFLTYPERYNLKFIYSNDAFYDPLLHFYGWHRLGRLENGVMVWEREDIPPLPERLPRRKLPVWQRMMWGTLPVAMPLLAYLSLLLPPFRSRRLPWVPVRLQSWLVEDALPPEPPSPWQPWLRLLRALEGRIQVQRKPLSKRLLASSLLALALLGLGWLGWRWLNPPDTPEWAVIRYWDHLDFKRFEKAWEWIAPTEGLTKERWQLDLSVQGGLRSGYAKLEHIRPVQVIRQDGRALVQVELTWLTALKTVQETHEHLLVHTPKGWRIEQRPLLKTRPPERFASQPGVEYFRAQRRLSTDITAAGDVLDRPLLRLRSARLVRYWPEDAPKPLLAIVGEVENLDARPADLTISGFLRGRDGLEISRNNARDLVLHKLLPGERTPFRIDFDGVTAPPDPAAIGDFEVALKAVVTSRELRRDLAIWSRREGDVLRLRVDNLGVREATVPQVLLSLYDRKGLAWVEREYLLESIPPREQREARLRAGLPKGYAVLKELRKLSESPNLLERLIPGVPADTRPLVAGDIRAYRLQAQAFYRED